MSKEPLNRGGPPETDEHWAWLYDGASKGHKGWSIVGPIFAVVTNWKALAAIFAVVAFFNRPEIAAAVQVLIGGKP